MNNYDYCAEFARSLVGADRDARVLDFGCGAGEIVSRLRARGIEGFGTDVFYEGGDYSSHVRPELAPFIARSTDERIPFPDSSFVLVVSNQVFEHVEDLDRALREIDRVLEPGGRLLSLFPDRGVWREGHCGIPFLHRFPKGSRFRVRYAMALRAAGLGHHKQNKSVRAWSEDFCRWLDRWTFYRPRDEIVATFDRWFAHRTDLEPEWLLARAGRLRPLIRITPHWIRTWVARKLAGQVFVCTKSSAPKSA